MTILMFLLHSKKGENVWAEHPAEFFYVNVEW